MPYQAHKYGWRRRAQRHGHLTGGKGVPFTASPGTLRFALPTILTSCDNPEDPNE